MTRRIEILVYLHSIENGIAVLSVMDSDAGRRHVPIHEISIIPDRNVPRKVLVGLDEALAQAYRLAPLSANEKAARHGMNFRDGTVSLRDRSQLDSATLAALSRELLEASDKPEIDKVVTREATIESNREADDIGMDIAMEGIDSGTMIHTTTLGITEDGRLKHR